MPGFYFQSRSEAIRNGISFLVGSTGMCSAIA
jgi:Arc/MetJ-type ribon-helix-helix transcriptional regulator